MSDARHSREGDEEGPARRELLDEAAARLQEAGRDAPRRTAAWLLGEVVGCDRAALYAHPREPVAQEDARRFRSMVDRRVDGEPLQHILGYDEFCGLRIEVSPAALIPRPETEEVVERALEVLDGTSAPRVLDVGTGTGCIALALKNERGDADVWGCDVSEDALALARRNARRLGLDVAMVEADVLDGAFDASVPGRLDLLVSNPPYIPDDEAESLPPVVREHDPAVALFAGEDPLRFYRALARWGPVLCRPGGWVVAEVHAEHAGGVADVFEAAGLSRVAVDDDIAGRPRIAAGRCP
jgi:release factor glutamine methyltransferase